MFFKRDKPFTGLSLKHLDGYVLKNTAQDLEQYFTAYALQTTDSSKDKKALWKDANNQH